MFPTREQIQDAAYHRWLHRGAQHGWHEADWREAEQALLFALNYRVKAFASSQSLWPRTSTAGMSVCRFCEHSAPRARFSPQRPALPTIAGLSTLIADKMCDDCHESIAAASEQPLHDWLTKGCSSGRLSLQAFKGLVAAALCVTPDSLIETCLETLEWVASERDESHLGPTLPPPRIYRLLRMPQDVWFALAAKIDAGAPFPAMIAFLGQPDWTLQFAIPLCTLDDELDGEAIALPDVPALDGLLRWPGPVECRTIEIETPKRVRRRLLEPVMLA
jgi:hypothetical protein